MKVQLNAAYRIAAAEDDEWFKSLTEEQQKKYIELHPNSKYAEGYQAPENDAEPEHDELHKTPEERLTPKEKVPPKPKAKPVKKPAGKAKAKRPKENKRYPVTKKLVDFLKGLFKNPANKATNIPSPGWRKKHGADAPEKVSPYGYFKARNQWVSETKEEWDANYAKHGGEVNEGTDGKIIRTPSKQERPE